MPKALLNWSLNIDCPNCDTSNDLASGDHDSENSIAKKIFNNDWDKLKGFEITCEHCKHEFTIDEVEY